MEKKKQRSEKTKLENQWSKTLPRGDQTERMGRRKGRALQAGGIVCAKVQG